MTRFTAWMGACAIALASSGCAAAKAELARKQRLEAELDALRYPQPQAEVWQAVRQLLADEGCPLAGADAEAVGQKSGVLQGLLSPAKETHSLRSDVGLLQQLGLAGGLPPQAAEGSVALDPDWRRKQGDRFHADGLVEPDGFRVILTRIELDPSNFRESRTRALDAELALARRLAPDAAARIESSVASAPSR